MNELVYLKNNKAVCDSLQVAEKKLIEDVNNIIISSIEENYDNGFTAFDYWFKDTGNKESLLLLACEFLMKNDLRGYKLLKAYSRESYAYGQNTGYLEFLIQSGHISQFLKRSEDRKRKKKVYVFDMSGKFVKIGVSEDTSKRSKQVSNSSGIPVTRIYETNFTDNSYLIESKIHALFKKRRMSGEFFSVPFEEAVEAVKNLAYLEATA